MTTPCNAGHFVCENCLQSGSWGRFVDYCLNFERLLTSKKRSPISPPSLPHPFSFPPPSLLHPFFLITFLLGSPSLLEFIFISLSPALLTLYLIHSVFFHPFNLPPPLQSYFTTTRLPATCFTEESHSTPEEVHRRYTQEASSVEECDQDQLAAFLSQLHLQVLQHTIPPNHTTPTTFNHSTSHHTPLHHITPHHSTSTTAPWLPTT